MRVPVRVGCRGDLRAASCTRRGTTSTPPHSLRRPPTRVAAADMSAQGRFMETGLAADEDLVSKVPVLVRAAFFLTNAPYWFLCAASLTLLLHGGSRAWPNSECGPEVYALFTFLVAGSSTLMHANQLRLGSCCCAHEQKKACVLAACQTHPPVHPPHAPPLCLQVFNSRPSQIFTKRLVRGGGLRARKPNDSRCCQSHRTCSAPAARLSRACFATTSKTCG
jgi:hypothetical protein